MSNNMQDALSFEAFAELEDGTTYSGVRVRPKTLVQLEKTARVRKWGTFEQSPLTAMVFMAWHAGKLAGKHDLSFEAFEDQAVSAGCDVLDDDEGEDEGEDRPTSPGPGITPQ